MQPVVDSEGIEGWWGCVGHIGNGYRSSATWHILTTLMFYDTKVIRSSDVLLR